MSEGIRDETRTRAVLFAALASVLLFSTLLLPALLREAGAVLGLLAGVSPFPLAVVRIRLGPVAALVAALLAAVVLTVVFAPGYGLGFVLLAGPVLLVSEAVARGQGLLRGTAWAAGLIWLEVAGALIIAGPELAEAVLAPMEQSRAPEFLQGLRDGGLAPEQVEEFSERLRVAHAALQVVYPAAFFIAGAVLVLANALLLRGHLERRRPELGASDELEALRWPLGLAVAFCALGVGVLAPALRPIVYNGLLVVGFLFALQGLSVVGYYVRRLAAPALLRGALLVLVLLNPWAPHILALTGLFDTWLDFRRWADPPAGEGREKE